MKNVSAPGKCETGPPNSPDPWDNVRSGRAIPVRGVCYTGQWRLQGSDPNPGKSTTKNDPEPDGATLKAW